MSGAIRLLATVALLALSLGACAPAASPAPTVAAPTCADPCPVIIDTDLGVDDIFAIAVLLRDPAVDVRAILLDGTGLARCDPGLTNLRRYLVEFGDEDLPVACGRETAGPNGKPFPEEWRAATDTFWGIDLPEAPPAAEVVDAATLIATTLQASAVPITVVALGTWTNLEDAFTANPALLQKVDRIHTMAGAIDVPGNVGIDGVTPADGTEWNVAADPDSFAAVLALDVPVTMVPLDATNDLPTPADIATMLEPEHAAAGADLAYELYVRNPIFAGPGNFLWDTLAALLLTSPTLAEWESTTVTITPTGSQAGRIVRAEGGRPITFARSADGDAALTGVLAALRRGDPRPEPFAVGGTIAVTFDGTTCRVDAGPPTTGSTTVVLENDAGEPAGVLIAGVVAPRRWADAVAFVVGADFSDPTLVPPEWLIQVPLDLLTAAGTTADGVAVLPAGEAGVICATGEWPDLEFVDGGVIVVGD